MSDFDDLKKRALEIRAEYDSLNSEQERAVWAAKDYAMGFVGDVGDLMKLVMAKEKARHIDDVDAKLAHELSDCLWSLFVMAEAYDIDLKAAFSSTMDELEARIKEKNDE